MFNFNDFTTQSPKGILVIYFKQIYATIKFSWVFLFLIFKDFSKISSLGSIYIFLGLGAILIFFLIRAYLLFKNFQFKISEGNFILNQGILKKSNTSIPFERIQNINFKQNILQQIINVYEVNIETAGSSGTEIAIKALSFEKANALKKHILKNVDTKVEQIIQEVKKPILSISPSDLFKVSLTENHLRNLILFFAILIGFYQQISQIAESFGETEKLDGFVENSTDVFSASFLFILFLLIFLIITAFVTSFVGVFLVHFNLSAYLNKDDFEIHQGLFTKKSILLKKQKIQNITISTNPLKKLIGISFVTFKQAISGKVNTKKGKDKLIRIVGCKKEQVQIIKNNLFNFSTLENKEKLFPDSYYKKRMITYSTLFMVVIYLTLYYFFEAKILLSIILTLPLFVFLIHKKLKKRFYKISEDMLLVGNGVLETHITYLELFKVQNVKLKQTYFQARNEVADIVLQTASGKIYVSCLPMSKATQIYDYILFKVQTSTKEWM